MSSSRPLGTFIPNAVTSDILSFLSLDQKIEASLSSPTLHSIIHRDRLLTRECLKLRFEPDAQGFLDINTGNRYHPTTKSTNAACGSDEAERMAIAYLHTCSAVEHLTWGCNSSSDCNPVLNSRILQKLLKIEIVRLEIYGKIDLSPAQFYQLVFSVNSINVKGCEIDGSVITNQLLALLSTKDCSFNVIHYWNSPGTKAAVTDLFLAEVIIGNLQLPDTFILKGFRTNFTIQAIEQCFEGLCNNKKKSYTWDFGILGSDQFAAGQVFASKFHSSGDSDYRYITHNGHDVAQFNISTWDSGQHTLDFAVLVRFPLLTMSNGSRIPSEDVSSGTSDAENNPFKLFFPNGKTTKMERVVIHTVDISTCKSSFLPLREGEFLNIYCSGYNDTGGEFILTNSDEHEIMHHIKLFIKMCGRVKDFTWNHRELSDEVFEVYKMIFADKLVLYRDVYTLSLPKLMEFLTDYETDPYKYINLEELQPEDRNNETVFALLQNGFLKEEWFGLELINRNTMLTDGLFEKFIGVAFYPSTFSMEKWYTQFTIRGIESFLHHLHANDTNSYKLDFGILEADEESAAFRFLSRLEADPDCLWMLEEAHWDRSNIRALKFTTRNRLNPITVHLAISDKNENTMALDDSSEDLHSNSNVQEQTHLPLLPFGCSVDDMKGICYTEEEYDYFVTRTIAEIPIRALLDISFRLRSNVNLYKKCDEYLAARFLQMDLLVVLQLITEYHLPVAKEYVGLFLKETDVFALNIWTDQFYMAPFAQQTQILNMVLKDVKNMSDPHIY